MKKIFGALAVLAFFVGCGCQQNDEENGNDQISEGMIVYDCQGEEVQVVFDAVSEPVTAQLSFINRDQVIITLPRVKSASGEQYTDGDAIFWVQENEAMLTTVNNTRGLACTVMTSAPEEMDEI